MHNAKARTVTNVRETVRAAMDRSRNVFGTGLSMEDAPATPATDEATVVTDAPVTDEPVVTDAPTTLTLDSLKEVKDLPKWAQDLITSKNDEAATNRVKVKSAEADVVTQIKTLLGIETTEDIPTVESLTATLSEKDTAVTEATTRAQAAEVSLAVFKAATAKGVNADRLLNSLSFNKVITALDPTADDFAARVDTAITAETTTDPTLKTRAVVKGGGDLGGGSDEATVTQDQFRGMGVAERAALKAKDPEQYRRLSGR